MEYNIIIKIVCVVNTQLKYHRVSEIKKDEFLGKDIKIRGWVYRIRKQKDKAFIIIRDDRGGIIQCVLPSTTVPDITIESSLEIQGTLFKDERAKEGGYEIRGNDIKIHSIASNDFPIGEYQSTELLLDYRHLTLRTRKMITIAKIRATILEKVRNWFVENDWIEVNVPTLVKSAVEGGSTLFPVKYFKEEAFLSQSAQLYLEALIFSLGPVWTVSPSFRAEKSRTLRHLAEYLHLEAEAPWISLNDLFSIQEKLLVNLIGHVIKERKEELEFLSRDIQYLTQIKEPFDKLSYNEAIETLSSMDIQTQDDKGTRKIKWGDDLNINSEKALTQDRTNPVFVYGYPLVVKPFYVKEDPETAGLALTTDLLLPNGFGEVSSGGMREDNITLLKSRIEKEGLKRNSYSWYLDLRKYGSVPHGGFGIGIERLVRWITNLE
ncbi:MAG TPA: asparagine--tRNA ligase, partial [Nitrososphaeraceae archaeon]|nr:asparagine--tRNA ligase [Nitrososphaeraceae archaeon]